MQIKYLKNIMILLAIILIFVLAFCSDNSYVNESNGIEDQLTDVEIENELLDTILRNILRKNHEEPIYEDEIKEIEIIGLNISDKDQNLNGIEILENLSILSIQCVKDVTVNIENLSSIKLLDRLKSLSIWDCGIEDISLLSYIPKIERLVLNGNNIGDISSLSKLNELKSLSISGNKISDISPLSSLSNLVNIDLDNNDLIDLDPLTNLNKLESLNLNYNSISSITPLSLLKNLKNLQLGFNKISNIYSIRDLSNLHTIILVNNKVMKDLSPLLDVYNNGGFKPLNDSEPSIYLGDFEETEANLDIIEILIEAGIKVFLPNNNQ